MIKLKAFTLTELVAAMVVMTLVVSATLSVTKSKLEKVDKYHYYMTYSIAKDIAQNVMSQTLNYEDFEYTPSITTTTQLCNKIEELYNVLDSKCDLPPLTYSTAVNTQDFSEVEPQVTLSNGAKIFIVTDGGDIQNLATDVTSVSSLDKQGFTIYISISGSKKMRTYIDVFPYYLLYSGKMVPEGGKNTSRNKLGGAESKDHLTVNVLYDDFSGVDNTRLNKTLLRNVDFKTAACKSGFVISSKYCTLSNGTELVKDNICTTKDCYYKVNRPMRRLFAK